MIRLLLLLSLAGCATPPPVTAKPILAVLSLPEDACTCYYVNEALLGADCQTDFVVNVCPATLPYPEAP